MQLVLLERIQIVANLGKLSSFIVNLTIWCFLKKLIFIGKIREMALSGKVQFTLKALRELASIDLGLDEMDVCGILSDLKGSDFKERKLSTITGEYL